MSYDYPDAQAKMSAELQAINPRSIPLKKRLEQQRTHLQKALNEVEEAIAFVEKNPELEKFQNIMSKVGILY